MVFDLGMRVGFSATVYEPSLRMYSSIAIAALPPAVEPPTIASSSIAFYSSHGMSVLSYAMHCPPLPRCVKECKPGALASALAILQWAFVAKE
eukprot:9484341-Pyramimonas_sp.AAC.1